MENFPIKKKKNYHLTYDLVYLLILKLVNLFYDLKYKKKTF